MCLQILIHYGGCIVLVTTLQVQNHKSEEYSHLIRVVNCVKYIGNFNISSITSYLEVRQGKVYFTYAGSCYFKTSTRFFSSNTIHMALIYFSKRNNYN